MSTDDADRQLGEPIPPTEPNSDEDAIGTPAAALTTTAVPDEVDVAVEAVADGMVAVRLSSVTVEGKLMVEVEPARALADDLLEAADRAEYWEDGRLDEDERAEVLAAAERLTEPDGPLLADGDRAEVAQLVEEMNGAIGD